MILQFAYARQFAARPARITSARFESHPPVQYNPVRLSWSRKKTICLQDPGDEFIIIAGHSDLWCNRNKAATVYKGQVENKTNGDSGNNTVLVPEQIPEQGNEYGEYDGSELNRGKSQARCLCQVPARLLLDGKLASS